MAKAKWEISRLLGYGILFVYVSLRFLDPVHHHHPVTAFKARRCFGRVIKLGENATERKGVR